MNHIAWSHPQTWNLIFWELNQHRVKGYQSTKFDGLGTSSAWSDILFSGYSWMKWCYITSRSTKETEQRRNQNWPSHGARSNKLNQKECPTETSNKHVIVHLIHWNFDVTRRQKLNIQSDQFHWAYLALFTTTEV